MLLLLPTDAAAVANGCCCCCHWCLLVLVQVAAQATHHIQVVKAVAPDGRMITSFKHLDTFDQRVAELADMLGLGPTEGVQVAQELLAAAAAAAPAGIQRCASPQQQPGSCIASSDVNGHTSYIALDCAAAPGSGCGPSDCLPSGGSSGNGRIISRGSSSSSSISSSSSSPTAPLVTSDTSRVLMGLTAAAAAAGAATAAAAAAAGEFADGSKDAHTADQASTLTTSSSSSRSTSSEVGSKPRCP
jgi:hypothetical protein